MMGWDSSTPTPKEWKEVDHKATPSTSSQMPLTWYVMLCSLSQNSNPDDKALQASMVQNPTYFRHSDTPEAIPEYSPISITIVNPHPVNPAIAERMSDVLNWSGSPRSSHTTPTNRTSPQTLRSPRHIPQIPITPRTKQYGFVSPTRPLRPFNIGRSPPTLHPVRLRSPGIHSPPPARRTSATRMPTPYINAQPGQPTESPRSRLPGDQNRGHRRTVSSDWNIRSSKTSHSTTPADRTEPQVSLNSAPEFL